MDDVGHRAVLMEEVLGALQPRAGEVCVDCTVGRGGHAQVIAPMLQPGGRYVGLDVDPQNAAFSAERLAGLAEVVRSNFAAARSTLSARGVDRVDLLLADLGFASNQMSDPNRGLSFDSDGPLDMRLDPDLPTTAAELIGTLSERELADLIYRFGEERLSRRIARNIVAQRRISPINTGRQLAAAVRTAVGGPRAKIDPATRTFMALRIAVNGELEALEGLLSSLPMLMRKGGRAAIISFHSLEDRMVKRAFAAYGELGVAEVLTKKPVQASEQETRSNPRSRSAKLRVLRWTG